MKKWQYKLIPALLLVSLNGCGGEDATKSKSDVSVAAPVVEAVAQKKPTAKPVKYDRDSVESYRSVTAKSRGNGASVEIMVPSDIEIGPGRLIEYHEDADGTLYFISLIPQ